LTRSCSNGTVVALILGAEHALVDLACAFVLFRDLNAADASPLTVAIWIITYNTLAFATQAPLGLLIDRWRSDRAATLIGIAAVAVALIMGLVAPRTAAVIAGLGNALFHAGAGGRVLQLSGSSAGPVGLFVGPGALGLCLGILSGGSQAPYRPAIGLALAIAWVAAWWCLRNETQDETNHWRVSGATCAVPVWLCLGLLLATVTLRSTIGDSAVNDWRERSVAVLMALAMAATAGKMLGGVLADRLGWVRIGVGALMATAPLVALGAFSPLAAILGMLLLQASTPLTLKAIHRLMPHRPALAFGIPSAALLLGAVPGFFDVWMIAAPPALLVAALASAVALIFGLRSLGYRWSISGPSTNAQ
jgi:hypothetical protein